MKKIIILLCMTLFLCTGCIEVVEIPYSEITVEDSVFADKFYYSLLSEEEQLVYRELYQGIMNHETEIYVHSEDAEDANDILVSVIYDFGEIFWTDGTATSTGYEETMFNDEYAIVKVEYNYSKEERKTKEQEIEMVVSQVINSIPAEYTEYEKIKDVYEYLINNVSYVEDAPDNQNLYSALVNGQTVCAGYSKANQYLLNRMGIYCTYVVGTAALNEEFEGHAWNIVRCDGNYYYVDITWADPIEAETQNDIQVELLYEYLCCDETQLANTHRIDENYDYPECTSNDLDYYRMNQMYYEGIDRKQILNEMYASINANERCMIFKFADHTLYEEGRTLILQDLINPATERIARRYGLTEVKYYYEEQEVMNKLVIYWFYE